MTSSAERSTARLDSYLVDAGLERSRGRAAEAVRAGRVRVDGAIVRKPAHPVLPTAVVEVEPDAQSPYVSRGALKLSTALDDLAVDVTGRRCIDVGASTGGFTQVLLERGAKQVVAVDVGTDQLADVVRRDPRVVDLPRTHIADLSPDQAGRADLVVVDLSFISLRHVMPALVELTAADGDLLPMVKPQFEVGRDRLGAGGVVRDRELRRAAVLAVADEAAKHGRRTHGLVPSRTPGPAGNIEYFLLLRRTPAERSAAELWDAMSPPL